MVNAGESVSASIKVTAFVVESTGLITGDMLETDTERSPFDTFLLHRSLTDNQSLQLSWVDANGEAELIQHADVFPERIFPSLSLLTIPNEKEMPRVLRIIYTDN
jgi:hypothetical protein